MTTIDRRADRAVYRFTFRDSTDMAKVEEVLLLSILAVGCLHGQAAVRLEVGYAMSADSRSVVLDAGSALANAVARVFVGFSAHEFGEDAFQIHRGDSVVATRDVVKP